MGHSSLSPGPREVANKDLGCEGERTFDHEAGEESSRVVDGQATRESLELLIRAENGRQKKNKKTGTCVRRECLGNSITGRKKTAVSILSCDQQINRIKRFFSFSFLFVGQEVLSDC